MIRLLKKYRWVLLALVLLYSAIMVGLFVFTDAPQEVPFEYEIR